MEEWTLRTFRTEPICVVWANSLLNMFVRTIWTELTESSSIKRTLWLGVYMAELALLILTIWVETTKRDQFFNPLVKVLTIISFATLVL